MAKIALAELHQLARDGLLKSGANAVMAEATAKALVSADAQGLASHGVSRVPQYAGQLKINRAVGSAMPKVLRAKGGAALIDAAEGLAFAACELAIQEAITRAREHGIAFSGVCNSHHFGAAAYHLQVVAEAGLVGFAFGNSPSAMPAWGGKRALFGTNPIAASFPRRQGDQFVAPITIDLSLSEVARGKIMVAANQGKPIPLGWALDKHGVPTTDAKEALSGMMMPAGGVKGAMLALMVELMVCALTGAHFGFEADSFFVTEGNRPRIGQAFIAIDPDALAGNEVYYERVETLLAAMLADPEVRIPGYRRNDVAAQARQGGVEIPDALLKQLRDLAAA